MSELSNCPALDKISDKLNGNEEETVVYICELCGEHIKAYDEYYDIANVKMCKACGDDYVKENLIFKAGI